MRILLSVPHPHHTVIAYACHGNEAPTRISHLSSNSLLIFKKCFSWLDSPRYLEIGDIKPAYKLGDLIRCTGEGNPPPILQWVSKKGEVREGRILAITSEMTVRTKLCHIRSISLWCLASVRSTMIMQLLKI